MSAYAIRMHCVFLLSLLVELAGPAAVLAYTAFPDLLDSTICDLICAIRLVGPEPASCS